MANIEIKMKESAITLATQGTYCETDIEINAELQSKTVTENGTIVPDEGYLGLESVIVNIPLYADTSAIAGVGVCGKAIVGTSTQGEPKIEGSSTITFKNGERVVGRYTVPTNTIIERNPFKCEPEVGVFMGWSDGTSSISYPYTVLGDVTWIANIEEFYIFGVSGLENESSVLTRTYNNEGKTYSIVSTKGEITTDFDDIFTFEDVELNGNMMVKIPKFYKRFDTITDNQITAFSISNSKVNEDFQVYPCFLDESGNELDCIYISKGKATGSSSLATCVKGSTPLVKVTREQARVAAKNNGNGWQQLDWSILQLIRDLFCIVFATTNSQTIFEGRTGVSTSCEDAATVGNTWDIATPCGWSTTTMQNKFFGIEDIFGNVLDWCDGVTFSDTSIYITDKPSLYSDTTTGMTKIGTRPTSSSYIKTLSYNSTQPFFNYCSATGGSSSTYFGDYCSYSSSGVVLLVGGRWSYGSKAGLWCLNGDCSASDSISSFGARLAKRPI